MIILFLTIFMTFGFFYLSPVPIPQLPSIDGPLSLTIISEVEQTPHTIQMVGKLNSSTTNEKILLVLFNDPDEKDQHIPLTWKHGAECKVVGERVPIENARNPGQFDYREYMAAKKIYSKLELDNYSSITCEGSSWFSYGYDFRNLIINSVNENVDPIAFKWMAALIFGEKQYLDEEILTFFQNFNLSHLLAISGLHVGLTITGLYFFLYRTGVATKEGAKVLIIIFLPLYAFLAGAAPSVLRATLMAGIVMLLTFLKWKVPLTDILSLVALFLLILSPSYLDHVGFQFSFLVTMSLILSFPLLKRTENPIALSALISFISQFSILPLQLYYFFEFNPLSLFANLLLVPYFSFLVIPFLMMLLLCSFVLPQISLHLSKTLLPVHTSFLSFLETHSDMFDIQWVVGEIHRSFIIVYLVLFIIMMRLWIKQKLGFAFAAGVASVGVVMVYCVLPYISPYGRVTMLDVGQGDSFVIELPYRRGVIMIDAAGPPVFTSDESKTAEQIILPYLKSRGIFKLDAIIITHEDTDHSGSVKTLVNEMEVGNLVVSLYYPKIETVENVVRVKAGEQLVIADQNFNLLHPYEDTGDANDNSIVLTITLGGLEWIFTGDASAEIEKLLTKKGSNIKADVLKVGHHGSHTSTSENWVKQVSPSVAFISAGLDNRYGHPHEEVVERLSAQGVVLFSTPDHGAVHYDFSSERGTFSSFLPYNASRE